MRGKIDKDYKLLTGKNLHEYDRTGKEEVVRKEKKHKVIRDNYSHKQILANLYKELIFNNGYAEVEGYSEAKNPILPPLFVDRFIGDFDKIEKITDYWRNREFSDEDKTALREALTEAGLEADKYPEKFDFDNALKFYKRLNSAAEELADSEKLSSGFLLKQVKIYFYLEQYDKCRELIEACKINFEKQKLNEELGELYYYMGMIAICTYKLESADNYFIKSSKLMTKKAKPETTAIYYRSRIRRFILKKDFIHALSLLNESIGFSIKFNLTKELAYLYGLKAEIQIRNFKHEIALESLNRQKEYASSSGDVVSEAKSISQTFSICSYLNLFKDNEALKNLDRVKEITKLINKNSYFYNCLTSYAIYLFRNDRIDDSEFYLKKALKIFTAKTANTESHIVNMLYLSNIQTMKKNFFGAKIVLNRMLNLCDQSRNNCYSAYIHNSLGRIYYDQNEYLKSNLHLNKALKKIVSDNITDKILVANSYMYTGFNNYALGKNNVAIKHLKTSLDIYNNVNEKSFDKQIQEYIDKMKSIIDEINSNRR